jgi:hypothetical protein
MDEQRKEENLCLRERLANGSHTVNDALFRIFAQSYQKINTNVNAAVEQVSTASEHVLDSTGAPRSAPNTLNRALEPDLNLTHPGINKGGSDGAIHLMVLQFSTERKSIAMQKPQKRREIRTSTQAGIEEKQLLDSFGVGPRQFFFERLVRNEPF